MKISLEWLRDYIPNQFDSVELAQKLTMVGLEVEEILKDRRRFEGVVVAEVLDVQPHPNSDKLKVCQVDTGNGKASVICGAPNVRSGQLAPFAGIGSRISEGNAIESVTIRGVISEGMICSERELGISDDHSGIMILDPKQYRTGDPFFPNSNHSDVFEIAIPANRPDCLSHIGIAREVAAFMNKPLRIPESKLDETKVETAKLIRIDVQDAAACGRYSARIVQNVKIGPSPDWLKKRIESVGIRSINNVVDITNFVLMETGHPLHAFDYDLLQENRILVRKAKEGESFTTLDGKAHRLLAGDLLICDGKKPVALAGVMGGLNTEVSEKTRNVLIESAHFDPLTIRRTGKRLGISSEASYRFERGTDPENTVFAANRAAALLAQLAGGSVTKGIVDLYPKPHQTKKIRMRLEKVKSLIGLDLDREAVRHILSSLGMTVGGDDPLWVSIPSHRLDLHQEADLIEELVRQYGYEKIEPQLKAVTLLQPSETDLESYMDPMRDAMAGLGFYEIMSRSMVSEKHNKILFPNDPSLKIQNPLSPDTAYLRTNMTTSLLDAVRWNQNRWARKIQLFEIGKTYHPTDRELPDERWVLAAAMGGLENEKPFWNAEEKSLDFYHAKGYLEAVLDRFLAIEVSFMPGSHPSLKDGTSLSLNLDGQCFGHFGEIRHDILKEWDIEGSIYYFEFSPEFLFRRSQRFAQVSELPRFPAVKRDLALVVDETIAVGLLKDSIQKNGGDYLTSIELFDVYRGKQIQEGKKSVAFALTFLSQDRTLTEEEVDPIINLIVAEAAASFSATLRT